MYNNKMSGITNEKIEFEDDNYTIVSYYLNNDNDDKIFYIEGYDKNLTYEEDSLNYKNRIYRVCHKYNESRCRRISTTKFKAYKKEKQINNIKYT